MIDWHPWEYTTKYGFTLRGQHTAPRGKPVLHFIHGNSYSGLTYAAMWQALHADFDIFLHDAQGHGDSDEGGAFIGWNQSAELALQVANELLPKLYPKMPVFGCGHSFGGILTLLMSERQPMLFNQLVLLDPILFLPSMIAPMRVLSALHLYALNPYAKRARRRRSFWPDASAAYQGLHQRGMFRGWSDASLQAYVDHAMHQGEDGQWQLKCSPRREAEIFSSYAHGLWPYLRNGLKVPTHVWGGQDTYPFVQKSLARWQAANDKVSLAWVEGGHCFMLEHPEKTAALVRASVLSAV
ncbi:MAG: alpha/beta hydrolase [Idiomarina sp.]|nr:alpha/beta hydrolase [Idiomarina sp.]